MCIRADDQVSAAFWRVTTDENFNNRVLYCIVLHMRVGTYMYASRPDQSVRRSGQSSASLGVCIHKCILWEDDTGSARSATDPVTWGTCIWLTMDGIPVDTRCHRVGSSRLPTDFKSSKSFLRSLSEIFRLKIVIGAMSS